MRNTVFRRTMAEEFGAIRAATLASDHVLSAVGGRTANQALDAGVSAKEVWRAICEEFDIPQARR